MGGQPRSFDRKILVTFFKFYGLLETFLAWTTLLKIHTGFFMGTLFWVPSSNFAKYGVKKQSSTFDCNYWSRMFQYHFCLLYVFIQIHFFTLYQFLHQKTKKNYYFPWEILKFCPFYFWAVSQKYDLMLHTGIKL